MKNIKKLFAVLDKWKPYYYLASVLLIATSFIRMLEPKILQLAVDGVVARMVNGSNVDVKDADPIARFFYSLLPEIKIENLEKVLIGLGLIYLVIAFFRGLTQFIASILAASSTEKSIKKLRDTLFNQIQTIPLGFYQKVPTGEMVQRCTGDIDTVKRFILNDIVEVIRLSAIFVGAFIMMVTVHVPYALIAISLVPVIMLLAIKFFRKEGKVWDEHEKEQDKLTAIVQENLTGIRVVKAFAREEEEIQKFIRQNKEKLKVGLKQIKLHMYYWPLSDLLVNLQITTSLMAGGYFALSSQITIGEFASFFTYSIMVTWPMRHVGQIVSRMGMAAVAMDRMSSILEAKPEVYEGEIKDDFKLKGDIQFKDVSFKYKEDEDWVLKNVSFKISEGEKVAIIGPTGAGKSTIISLLTRFYEPQEGEIMLDGKALNKYGLDAIRKRIGVVLQKPFLFSSSIRTNIAFCKPYAEDEIVESAAKAASIDHILQRFPKGFETVVGEKGVTLSGGQKQRVSLARTLLSNPDVLVLDDTTSAVDTETESAIQRALKEKSEGKTVIMIAHRLTSIQHADKIIVMDKGKVTEIGTPEELLKSGGYYSKVLALQTELESDILRT